MALVFHKNLDRDTSFALWRIEEEADDLVSRLQLKEHEKNYLESISKNKRNLQWLSTRVLLRSMMNTDHYIDCHVDEHGKPYLANFPYFISLSHSFDYAAVMISKTRPVGIDIEQIKTKINFVAHKFMNADELAFMDTENRIEHLYVSWCAKEAIYKLQGKKNVSFLDHIRLNRFKYSEAGSLQARLESNQDSKNFEVHYQKLNGYMIGYVADENHAK